MKKTLLATLLALTAIRFSYGQDTVKQQRFSFHFQETTITQFKPSFYSPYQGMNSLSPNQETQSSITSTLFGSARLWQGAEAGFDPELSGGSGLSKTEGIAAFPNG